MRSGCRIPYPVVRDSEAFDLSIAKIIHASLRQQTGSLIPLQNSYFLPHGKRWALQREGDNGTSTSELQPITAEGVVAHSKLIDHDPTVIVEFINNTIREMASQFSRLMYQVVGSAADEVGNTVSRADYATLADTFLEMMRKIKFSVTKDGSVSLPEIHVHPSNAKRFIDELRRQPASFSREVQVIKAQKRLSALEDELARLKKFYSQQESEERE
ncbi:MAG: hypothetical protein E6J34_15420 [Chloroflexi bacterium]|nr:MAG: hypothetical protein E6J34_15420 [Chloroflexota bacterium]